MHKVLLILGSEDFRDALAHALEKDYEIRVCGSAAEGAALLDWKPDALLMDLYLPGVDGFTFLAEHRDTRPRSILVLSSLINDYIQQAAADVGVSFLMYNSSPLFRIVSRLRDILEKADAPPEPEIMDSPEALLEKLQFPLHRKAARELCLALPMFARNPQQKLSGELYPAVGRHFHCSGKSVEKAIRDLLKEMWKNRDRAVWDLYFPKHASCPSNKDFLTILLRFLR